MNASEVGTTKWGELGSEQAIMLRFLRGTNSDAAMMGAARYFRKLLSSTTNCKHSGLVVNKWSLVMALVDCLQQSHASDLQLDACWALTNIACGDSDDTHLVVQAAAVPVLVRLAQQGKHVELRDQAIWCLSNIAGDCNACRSRVLREDFVGVLVQLLRHESLHTLKKPFTGIDTLHTVVWALSNVCRVPMNHANGKQYLLEAVPLLATILNKTLHQPAYKSKADTVADICWTVAYLADGSAEEVQSIVNSELGDLLMTCMNSTEDRQVAGALRAVGNLATSNDAHTQYIVDMGAVRVLARLVNHTKDSIRREAVWTISNITAGNESQIQAVLHETQLVKQLIVHLDTGDMRLQKEAAWALCNAVAGGSLEQKRMLLSLDICRRLVVPLLQQTDERILCTLLEAMDKALTAISTHHMKVMQLHLMRQVGCVQRVDHIKNNATNPQLSTVAHNLADNFTQASVSTLPNTNKSLMVAYHSSYPYYVPHLSL